MVAVSETVDGRSPLAEAGNMMLTEALEDNSAIPPTCPECPSREYAEGARSAPPKRPLMEYLHGIRRIDREINHIGNVEPPSNCSVGPAACSR